MRSHYAVTNLSLTGHLKYKGILKEEILEMSITAILTKFLIGKKRLIKSSPSLASQKKGECLINLIIFKDRAEESAGEI